MPLDPEIRKNREAASAIGILVLLIIGVTLFGAGIVYGLKGLGIDFPPELVGLLMGGAIFAYILSRI